MLPLDREPIGAEQGLHGGTHLAGDPRIGLTRVPRVDREPFTEGLAPGGGRGGERLDRWPRALRVDVIRRHRRHPTPVVDPGVQQPQPLRRIGQVRRRLHAHVGAEDDPGGRDGREERLVAGLGRPLHRRAPLRAEVLHDHLLDVPEPPVQVADREQRLGALPLGLSDPHEDTRRERDREAAGVFDRAQAHRRQLVGRVEVRSSAHRQAPAGGLEHDAHRCAHVLEPGELLVRHHARVQMRQQPRLLEHADRYRAQVLEGGREPALGEPVPRFGVPILGSVAEGEQRFLATRVAAPLGDRHDLVGREVRMVELGRRLREGAIVTVVAAEHRERHEHLARIRHGVAPSEIAQPRRHLAHPNEVVAASGEERPCLVQAQRLALFGAREGPADGVRRPPGHAGEPTTLFRG